MSPVKKLILISVLVTALNGAVAWYVVKKVAPPAQTAPAQHIKYFVLETADIKSVQDVTDVLGALNIQMQVNMDKRGPDVEAFKKAQRFFREVK